MKALCLTTTVLMLSLLFAAYRWAPKPEIDVELNLDGGQHIKLICPKGWSGYSEWHTISGTDLQEQWRQYLFDAQRGVCREVK